MENESTEGRTEGVNWLGYHYFSLKPRGLDCNRKGTHDGLHSMLEEKLDAGCKQSQEIKDDSQNFSLSCQER